MTRPQIVVKGFLSPQGHENQKTLICENWPHFVPGVCQLLFVPPLLLTIFSAERERHVIDKISQIIVHGF